MKKIISVFLLMALGVAAKAQFTQAAKDSAIQWLEYPIAKYSIQLGFRTEDYAMLSTNGDSLLQWSSQQLLDKRTGRYTDAALLRAAFTVKVQQEKDTNGITQLLNEAGQLYEQWINAEPRNVRPLEELTQLCAAAGNHALMPAILDYGLGQFPDHLPLLYQAVHFYLNVSQQIERSQALIDQILAKRPNDLIGLHHSVALASYRNMQALQQGQDLELAQLPLLQAALQQQPNDVGLRHLDWFRRLFHLYFVGIGRLSKVTDVEPEQFFEYFNLTQQELNELTEAENWMMQAVAKKEKNEGMLYSNLGVITCMKKQYGKAASFFEKAHGLIGREMDLEAHIMACFLNGDFEGMAKGIRQKIAAQGQPIDYGALLRVYGRYLKQPAAIQPLLLQLAQVPATAPMRNQVLATGYLHTGQLAAAQQLLPLLGDSQDDWMIKLTAAIVGNQRQEAINALQALLQLNPDHKKAKQIKAMAGL